MRVQITNGMLIALIINMVYAKAIGLTQGIMAREAGADMWIATLLATAQGMFVMWVIARTQQRLPQLNFIEHASTLFGKWAGRLVGILFIVFFLGAFGSVMITFVYHLMDYFLPEMPILIFVIVGTTVGVYAIYFGLEVVARFAFVGLFSIIALNVLLMLGSLKDFDIRELLPVFQNGFVHTAVASRHNDTDWAMATMMTAMIYNHVKSPIVCTRSGVLGILYGGLSIAMWPILEAGVLSPEVTSQYIVACMQMARSAEIGLFIHRYEMIMVAFFATSALVQTAMCLFCASLAASQVIGLKDYRPLVLPIALLFGGFGYWTVLDHNQAMNMLSKHWPMVALPLAFGIPLLLYLLGFLRRKKWTNH